MKWRAGPARLPKVTKTIGFRPWGVIFLAALLLLTGCASSLKETAPVEESIPAWVMSLPVSDEYFHAVGISGPSYYYEDGVVRAADAARVELAKTLSSHVQEITLIVENTNGVWMADEAQVLQALSSVTEVVLEHSEIVAAWVDRRGSLPGGQPGTTYALARISKVIRLEDSGPTEP